MHNRRMSQLRHIRQTIFAVSQSEFAAISNVSQATVSRWEKGDLSPGLAEMSRIRDAAKSRGLAWDDALFFPAPAGAPEGNAA